MGKGEVKTDSKEILCDLSQDHFPFFQGCSLNIAQQQSINLAVLLVLLSESHSWFSERGLQREAWCSDMHSLCLVR